MKQKSKLSYLLFPAIVFLALIIWPGCQEDILDEGSDLSIHLVHKVGDKPMILNEWLYEAPVGHPYKVRRVQMLLSDFTLYKIDGGLVEFDTIHYYEYGRSETKSFVLNNIPPGKYTHLGFNFGLDEEKNLDNAYPDNYDMINFKWPTALGKGYHYMRFEVTADSMGTGVVKDFNLHTGATHGNDNHLSIKLAFDAIEMDGLNYSLDLLFDMNEWLVNPNLYDFEEFGHGIMGNQEAQTLLKNNGPSVFSLQGPIITPFYK